MSNVDSSKLFFGIVLNKLQDSFPAAIFLSSQTIWPDFEKVAKGGTVSVKTRERSYRTLPISELADNQALQAHYTKLMLRWMAAEGYLVSDPVSNFPYDYVLSSKSLAALSIPIDKKTKTIGQALASTARKTGDAAQSELISSLVDRILDYF
jgi:hypothetical protein